MSTFIGQLIGFLVIIWIIWRYAVPPVRRLMASQQEAVRNQLDESAKAAQRLADADKYHAQRVEEAKAEAKHITEEARVDAERIGEQLRVQADVEAERIKVQGGQQVSLLRAQMIRQLRQELGTESVRRAADLVRAHVADPAAQSATVDRFLDELDSMAPAAFTPVVSSDLRSASRDAQAALIEKFDSVSSGLSGDALSTLSDELASVAKLLVAEPILARHLAEASGETEAKKQLLQRLLAGKVGDTTLDVLNTAASVRWSLTSDLVDAVEHIARLSLLTRAERENQADEVEEQLFRFSRILDAQPQLTHPARRLLQARTGPGRTGAQGDEPEQRGQRHRHGPAGPDRRPAARRTGRRGRAGPGPAGRGPPGRDRRAGQRGNRSERLPSAAGSTELLARIYNHPVSVQLNIDPDVLGGLSVAVGDEVIDGTLSSRLAAAVTKLPD